MSCCGKKRTVYQGTSRKTAEPSKNTPAARKPRRDTYAYFQYLGRTGLTVQGPISGTRYRFERPGAIVAVDVRDRRSLATVSVLQQVQRPW